MEKRKKRILQKYYLYIEKQGVNNYCEKYLKNKNILQYLKLHMQPLPIK